MLVQYILHCLIPCGNTQLHIVTIVFISVLIWGCCRKSHTACNTAVYNLRKKLTLLIHTYRPIYKYVENMLLVVPIYRSCYDCWCTHPLCVCACVFVCCVCIYNMPVYYIKLCNYNITLYSSYVSCLFVVYCNVPLNSSKPVIDSTSWPIKSECSFKLNLSLYVPPSVLFFSSSALSPTVCLNCNLLPLWITRAH